MGSRVVHLLLSHPGSGLALHPSPRAASLSLLQTHAPISLSHSVQLLGKKLKVSFFLYVLFSVLTHSWLEMTEIDA